MENFTDLVLQEVLASKANHLHDNFDPMMVYDSRYQSGCANKSLLNKFYQVFLPLGNGCCVKRHLADIFKPVSFYRRVVSQYQQFSNLYNLLADQASKKLLIKLTAYKILGYKKIKLPRNNKQYWQDIEKIKPLNVGTGELSINFADLKLGLYDLSKIGYDIKVNVTPVGAATIFTQKQYEYHHGDVHVKPNAGNVVIDCGACWGETALYFAHETGAEGKVYAFEFIPANLDVFNINLNHNPHLKNRIELVERPVWEKSDESLFYSDNGPGSSVSDTVRSHTDTQCCKTMSIDDLVSLRSIPSVHFIKMDIEGAEMSALKGAEKTIRRDRPALAISLYHKEDDFITIPAYINELQLGYKFYLEHHTIHFWETVLFAIPS